MIASEILDRVSMQLDDQTRTRWTEAMLLNYLTDAMRQMSLERPDSHSTVIVQHLVQGSNRQTIPTGMAKLLRVVRNMGIDGTTPGQFVTATTRDAMETLCTGWVPNAQFDEIDQYAFVQATPQNYWVWPTPSAYAYLELECCADVAQLTAMNATIPFISIWSEPLREYVLYRAFSQNGASQADQARAVAHLQQFYVMIGNEAQARILGNPYNKTYSIPTGQ